METLFSTRWGKNEMKQIQRNCANKVKQWEMSSRWMITM